MDYEKEVTQVVSDAFVALRGSHPELLARISSAIDAARGNEFELQRVESAFRDAAKTLLATDKAAAQTLFTAAETLGEISSYWGLPRDLP
jgi:hypothetical protein